MTGRHYNYAYRAIQDCGNAIESDANKWSAPHFDDWGDKRDPLPADILAIMRRAVTALRVASKMAHDIEWYMSCDYGNDTLRACAEGWQDGHAERDALQAAGLHPAPCARSCEANAYEIEIRRLKSDNAILRAQIDTLVGTIAAAQMAMAGAPIWSQGHRDAIRMLNVMREVVAGDEA